MSKISVLMALGSLTSIAAVSADVCAAPPSSPPRKCEIRQAAWCIDEEVSNITDELADVASSRRIWTLSDINYPRSSLVVMEPAGCRNGFADTVVALEFEEAVEWRGRFWDRMQVRLRADGSCDLGLWVPLPESASIEWAFSNGRKLIMACGDEKCSPRVPTPADVTEQFRARFNRSEHSKRISPATGIDKSAEHAADLCGVCRIWEPARESP